ncbi:acetolactate synthase large subunit [mine drainage metagenome]|uniref:Acetolactate synthase large subunit n=1 Tax=mine drainage metagenome TaxID=410659 RepID=A0A1J5QJ91_9ZZZZ
MIDITKNAQIQKFNFEGYTPCNHIRSYRPKPIVRPQYIQQAAELINQAKKPFIIWGQGVILGSAEQEFKTFVEKSGIPAAWTILGAGAIPTNHPLNVGMLGMHGNYGPNVLTNECDVLIAIGMRFDDRVTGHLDKYAKQAKVIHLDIDPAEIDKNVKSTVPVWGDCKETLPMLTELVERKVLTEWHDKFKEFTRQEVEAVIDNELNPTSDEMTMGEVIKQLNELTKGDAVIVTDVGQHQMVACRYANLNKTRSNVTSGGLGTMGFALPAAIGDKFGAQERDVIAIIGDGGFQMTLQELGTVMQSKVDIKIIILNNRFLGMVRQWQEVEYEGRYSHSYMDALPNFVKLAEAYGHVGMLIERAQDVEPALREARKLKDRTVFMDFRTDPTENVFPMVRAGNGITEMLLSSEDL